MQQSASALFNRLLSRGKFRHLQILIKLAELGSVQRTANAIGMTQSSVTQTLAYLERLLETQLFERHSRGVRATPACSDLLPVAQQVLQGIAGGVDVVVARQQAGRGSVRIAASMGAINGLLVDLLPRFGQLNPAITMQITEWEGENQLLAIARGEVDVVACRRPPVVPEGWRFIALREDRFAVLCRAGHPMAGRVGVEWSELAEQVWLLAPVGSAARERFDVLATRFPHPPHAHAVVTRSPVLLWWLLRYEEALAFLPINFARPLVDADEVRELDVSPASPLEPLGLLRPVAELPEAAERFVLYLENRASADAEEKPAKVTSVRSKSGRPR